MRNQRTDEANQTFRTYQALDFESVEHRTRVDLQNGCVVMVDLSVLRDAEEGDEEALRNVPKWQKPEVEIARAIVEDSGERFVAAPTKFDFHEYGHMERFVGAVKDPEAAEQLWRAIKGKGAFRHFKDTASRLGLLEQWRRYRNNAVKEFVIGWAEDHKVPFLDDIK
jgi:hypothetical protein